MHTAVTSQEYLDIFVASGIARTHKMRIQNTGTMPIYVISSVTQPNAAEEGEIVEATEYSEGYLGYLWVRTTRDEGAIQIIDLGVPVTSGDGGVAPSVTVADYLGSNVPVEVQTMPNVTVEAYTGANIPVDVQSIPDVTVAAYTGSPIPTAPIDYAGHKAGYTMFGEGMVAEVTNQVNVQFQYSISNIDTTSTITGTGSTSHTQGIASIHTGTGVGSAAVKTRDSIRYVTGHMCIAEFTAIFAGNEANVNSFHGPSDSTSFAAIGYQGTQFGFKITYGATTQFYPISSLNLGDGFILDPSKMNLYRVTYAWFGIAPITFSVLTSNGWKVMYVFDKLNVGVVPI